MGAEQEIWSRLATALEGPEAAQALVTVAQAMKNGGQTKAEVETIFRELLNRCLVAGNEVHEDAVRDALDYVVGWCVPSASLFDDKGD